MRETHLKIAALKVSAKSFILKEGQTTPSSKYSLLRKISNSKWGAKQKQSYLKEITSIGKKESLKARNKYKPYCSNLNDIKGGI